MGYHLHKSLDFADIDTEEKAYVIGLLGADGSIFTSRGRYYTVISLRDYDVGLVERVRDIISPTRKVYLNKREGKGTMATLSVCDKNLYLQLLEHGIVPKKSLKLSPPPGLPLSLVSHYVRGLFDGDGTLFLTKTKAIHCAIYGSENTASFVHHEFSKLQRNTMSVTKIRNLHAIRYFGLNAIRFLRWMYADSTIHLERKYLKAKGFMEMDEAKFRRRWAEEDLVILKGSYLTKTKEDIMEELPDFSWYAIKHKANRIGLCKRNKKD